MELGITLPISILVLHSVFILYREIQKFTYTEFERTWYRCQKSFCKTKTYQPWRHIKQMLRGVPVSAKTGRWHFMPPFGPQCQGILLVVAPPAARHRRKQKKCRRIKWDKTNLQPFMSQRRCRWRCSPTLWRPLPAHEIVELVTWSWNPIHARILVGKTDGQIWAHNCWTNDMPI